MNNLGNSVNDNYKLFFQNIINNKTINYLISIN